MLTELHIGLARPEEAIAFLRGAKVDYLAFCRPLPRRNHCRDEGRWSLCKSVGRQRTDYLHPVPIAGPSGLQIYRVELP